MKKVLFVISSFTGGGAEKALVVFLRSIDRSAFEPSVAVFNPRNDYESDFPRGVAVHLVRKRHRLDFLSLAMRLARLIGKEKPDVVCAFMNYANLVAIMSRLLFRWRCPLVVTEQNNLTAPFQYERLAWLKKRMVMWLYPKADAVVAISSGVKDDLVHNFNIPESKFKVIHNPFEFDRIIALSKEPVDGPWFDDGVPVVIGCGRLTIAKNFPLLLRAMKLVLRELPARLLILGQGEDHAALIALAQELGVSQHVHFLGFQNNPFKYMARAELFVLSSSWEGLANVLVEAMACGTPVVATNCPSGPDEVITNGVNGFLVPMNDERMLADAMVKVLSDDGLRNRFREAGRNMVFARFQARDRIREYEALFEELV